MILHTEVPSAPSAVIFLFWVYVMCFCLQFASLLTFFFFVISLSCHWVVALTACSPVSPVTLLCKLVLRSLTMLIIVSLSPSHIFIPPSFDPHLFSHFLIMDCPCLMSLVCLLSLTYAWIALSKAHIFVILLYSA